MPAGMSFYWSVIQAWDYPPHRLRLSRELLRERDEYDREEDEECLLRCFFFFLLFLDLCSLPGDSSFLGAGIGSSMPSLSISAYYRKYWHFLAGSSSSRMLVGH